MKQIEIFFHNLTEECQEEILDAWGTTPEDENWEYIPLAIIDREDTECI